MRGTKGGGTQVKRPSAWQAARLARVRLSSSRQKSKRQTRPGPGPCRGPEPSLSQPMRVTASVRGPTFSAIATPRATHPLEFLFSFQPKTIGSKAGSRLEIKIDTNASIDFVCLFLINRSAREGRDNDLGIENSQMDPSVDRTKEDGLRGRRKQEKD